MNCFDVKTNCNILRGGAQTENVTKNGNSPYFSCPPLLGYCRLFDFGKVRDLMTPPAEFRKNPTGNFVTACGLKFWLNYFFLQNFCLTHYFFDLGVPSKKKTVYLKTLSKLRLTPLPPTLFLTNLFLTKCLSCWPPSLP